MTWRNPTPEEALHKKKRQRIADAKYYHGPKHDELRARSNARRKEFGRAREKAYAKAHPELHRARVKRYMSKPENRAKSDARYKRWQQSPAGRAYAEKQRVKRSPSRSTPDRAAYRVWWRSPEGVAFVKSRGPGFDAERARLLQRRLLSTKRRAVRQGTAFEDALFRVVLEGNDPPTHCECCGEELDYQSHQRGGYHNPAVSIDRVDNTKGYMVGNCAFICARCNAVKADANADELRAIVAYIDRHAAEARS